MDEREHVAPLVPPPTAHAGSLAYLRPYAPGKRQQSHPRLVLGPDLYSGSRMALCDPRDGLIEPPFLNASKASSSFCG